MPLRVLNTNCGITFTIVITIVVIVSVFIVQATAYMCKIGCRIDPKSNFKKCFELSLSILFHRDLSESIKNLDVSGEASPQQGYFVAFLVQK